MGANDWTEAENRAIVSAYFEMLDNELANKPFVKAEVNKALRDGPLHRRSKGSVEFKLQNVSSFLHELGWPWVKGYKPHSNKQQALLPFITAQGEARGWSAEKAEPTADPDELAAAASELLKRPPSPVPPAGQTTPAKTAAPPSERFLRSPQIVAWVLRDAAGMCECCGSPAPFKRANGEPYLEVHHVRRLADGGTDTVQNAVAVCPNCHRLLHYAAEARDTVERLYSVVKRLQRQ